MGRLEWVGAAHPRSRGEHFFLFSSSISLIGSSPLARGTRGWDWARRWRGRLIPARAGNTLDSDDCRASSPAHPRSRGEHTSAAVRNSSESGSSPLARGTPDKRTPERMCRRLIPARAGNTLLQSGASVSRPAHPRSRGEHPRPPSSDAASHGSSPLARGTPDRDYSYITAERLIPARAGNTMV